MDLKPFGNPGASVSPRFSWFGGLSWVIFTVTMGLLLGLFGALIGYGAGGSWAKLLDNAEFLFAVGFTLKTTFLATLAATIIGIPCGWILARRRFPGKVLVEILLDLPMILPPLISGVALLILFGPVLGRSLERWGVEIVFSPWGVVVAQWFIALPLAVKMFRQSFDGIDPRYENVARTLGCSPESVFFRVTLPLAKRGILAGMAMAWARTIGEFGATAMLAGVTRLKTETLAAAVFLNMSMGQLELALGISIIMFLTAVVILAFFKMLLKE